MNKNEFELKVGKTTFHDITFFSTWDYEKFVGVYGKVNGMDVLACWTKIQEGLKKLGYVQGEKKKKREKSEKLIADKKELGMDTKLDL